jgi:hypothetical protein
MENREGHHDPFTKTVRKVEADESKYKFFGLSSQLLCSQYYRVITTTKMRSEYLSSHLEANSQIELSLHVLVGAAGRA